MKFGSRVCNPFVTLACDFQCPYCITRSVPGWDFGYPARPSWEWAAALNALEDVEEFVFNGGEPTLLKDFDGLINSIAPSDKRWPDGWKIAIGTNGSPRARQVLLQIKPRADLIIDMSFHPTHLTLPEIVSTALALRDHGHNIRVHTISWPGLGVTAPWMVDQLTQLDIHSFVQNFDGWYDGRPHGNLAAYPNEQAACDLTQPPRKARCYKTVFMPVAPNGDVFICNGAMYARAAWGVIGNIFDGWMSAAEFVECPRYGHCNACDRPRRTEVIE